jgi:chromosome segregation ATPase
VRQTQEAQDQHDSVQELKRKLTILEQKKMRLNAEIDRQNKEMSDVQRNIRSLQNDMTKLNQLITKSRGQQELLEQGNSLMESDFIHTLKEAELDCIQLQTEVSQLKEEKERGKNGLLEAERQILLWERKIQLAKEMRAAVDSEAGQGEIKGMKAEIHRMEVRRSLVEQFSDT